MFIGCDEKEKRLILCMCFFVSYLAISVILFLPVTFRADGFDIVAFMGTIPKLWWLKGILSALVVFLLALLPNYSLKSIKSKDVGDGQHGRARFATAEEVKAGYSTVSMYKERQSGFVVGRNDKGQWLLDTSDMSMLLLAPPGAGKTTRVILPTIYYNGIVNKNTHGNGSSLIITDLKGEALRLSGAFLKACGYKVLYINLRDPFKSYNFNLLNNTNKHMRQYLSGTTERDRLICYGRAERYAKILAQSLVHNIDVDSKSDASSYFNETAQGLLTGIILLVSEYAEENQKHLLSVFNLIIELNGMSQQEMSSNPNQKSKLAQMLENIPNERIKSYVGPAMSADFKTSMNIFSSALGKLVGLIDAELEQMISKHSDELNDFDFIKEPTAIFIICPDENPTRYFFASLFLRYFLNDLIEQARMADTGVLDREVLCLWDEFGNMPSIKNIDTLFSAARSARIRFLPTLQSLAQLEKSYNRNTAKIIRETCQITLTTYVSPMARETAEELSKILGNRTIQSGSVSTGKGGSQTIQMMSKPLLSVDEIINMPMGEFICIKAGLRPMQTTLPYYLDYLPKFAEYQPKTTNDVEPISRMSEQDVRRIGDTEFKLSVGMFD